MENNFIDSFQIKGIVENVLIAHTVGSHISEEMEKIDVFIRHGIKHDNHSGNRSADVREKDFLLFGILKRTEIANHREFSATSVEELSEIAKSMGIPNIPNGLLGENLIVSGIPNFTLLPIGTKLFFKRKGVVQPAVLIVSGENTPCTIPGKAIQNYFESIPNLEKMFVRSAINKRGVVGSVFCSGVITKGDEVTAVIPCQYIYKI
jgi:hypothetical protein